MQRRALPLACAALWAGSARPVRAAQAVLRVLAWPGYAEPEVVQAFEQQRGVRVELTLIDTDEALWQKLRQHDGADFDVLALNTVELRRAQQAGLLRALEPARIPGLARQLPRFQRRSSIPGLELKQGSKTELYGVPYTYAEMGLIHDRRRLPEAPSSISVLWEPRWRGKVLAYNGGSHNFTLAAQSLGLATPFRLQAGDWPRAVERLIALRRNVLGFYNQPEESVRLFQRHGAALMFANYGTQQLQLLRQAGANVGYAIPREGALAWLDCWALTRQGRETELAHAWIDHVLGEQASQLLVERQGLANTVAESIGSPGGAKLNWLEPVEDVARREALWARIRSGDRAERVLAP
jgi:putative spermidine/putrescine transport system substrate-binding protein